MEPESNEQSVLEPSADVFLDAPTTNEVSRYRMIAAGAVRIAAVALAVVAIAWLTRVLVEFLAVTWGFDEYVIASGASAAVLLLMAWLLWQNADALSGRLVRIPNQGRCPACGFDLCGVAHATCPECGLRRRLPESSERRPSYVLWHSALVVALRGVATCLLLMGIGSWLGWLSFAVSAVQAWPPFSWPTAATLAVAKLLPAVLLWWWAPAASRRALRGCEAWRGSTPSP